ncbi:MAG TPA: MFS transporter, partial [Firmicutes bacterium]|nr:MFS transporter [Bacillota bacterium]
MLLTFVRKKVPCDYAWIILSVMFLSLLASFGARASFGAYIGPWENEFATTRAVVTSVSFLSFVVFALGQPLAGKLLDYIGGRLVVAGSMALVAVCLLLTAQAQQVWQLFLYYGLGFSLGISGCSNVITTAIIARWFEARKGFAIGLTLAGMAVGQLVMVPVALFLINRFNWRIAMSLIGLVILVVVVPLIAFFVRSRPEDMGLLPYGARNTDKTAAGGSVHVAAPQASLWAVLRLREFWFLTVSYFICGFTDVGLIQTHLIPLVQDKGFAVTTVALTFSSIALFNILGTVGTGYLSDHLHRGRQLGWIYAIRAATFLLLLLTKTPALLLPFTVIYGMTEMASIAPTSALTASLFGQYSLGTILALVSVSHQLGGAFGSWVPGILYDLTGGYSFVLLLSIALLVVSGIVVTRIQ